MLRKIKSSIMGRYNTQTSRKRIRIRASRVVCLFDSLVGLRRRDVEILSTNSPFMRGRMASGQLEFFSCYLYLNYSFLYLLGSTNLCPINTKGKFNLILNILIFLLDTSLCCSYFLPTSFSSPDKQGGVKFT